MELRVISIENNLSIEVINVNENDFCHFTLTQTNVANKKYNCLKCFKNNPAWPDGAAFPYYADETYILSPDFDIKKLTCKLL